MSENLLLDVALSLTDGEDIDWTACQSGVSDQDGRVLLRLKQIEAVARFQGPEHRWPSGHDSIGANIDHQSGAPLRWGPLEILEKVGHGSYGDVYRARDPRLDRDLALKLLRHPERSTDGEPIVVREAHLLSRVRHPNVVTIHGAERLGGRTGLWMEFIEGETLEDELRRRGPLPAREVAQIGVEVCSALQCVHKAGLLHRDVKAQNIMRENTGRLVLMDFGAVHEAQNAVEHGLAGTPAYLAPELLAGSPPAVATDIYALGVVLFRLATGRFAVEARSLEQLRVAYREGPVPSVRSVRSDLPRALAGVIDRALSADPARRVASGDQMRESLESALESMRVRRLPQRLVAAGLLIAATATAGWLARSAGLFIAGPAAAPQAQQRLIWAAPDARAIYMGSASYDGRHVSSYDYETRGLIVRDLSAGTTRLVVAADGADGPEFSALSRDGARLAYAWRAGDRFQLRIAADGEAPRILLANDDRSFSYVIPCDWSPDGTRIVAALRRGDALHLVMIDTADGSHRILKQGHWGATLRAVFSPDGSHVAASLPTVSHGREHDVFLLPAYTTFESGGPAMIAGPSHDLVAGWSPDGRDLVFLSDRGGTSGVWALKILEARPAGAPVLLRPDASGTPLGMDASGALRLAVSISSRDIHVAAVDFETGELLSPPSRPVSRHVGTNRSPSFSPDGRALAFISAREGTEGGLHLVLQSLDDGRTRQLPLGISTLLQLSWAPDGRSIIGLGRHATTGEGTYRVDVATGEVTLVLPGGGTLPQLSPDGRILYFVRPHQRPPFELVAHELESGRERVLLRDADRMIMAVAPDGLHLATVLVDSPGATTQRRLLLLPAAGGRARELLAARDLGSLVRWTPDARNIIVTIGGGLAAVPADGRPLQRLDLGIVPPPQREEHLALHPDGRRIVFMAGETRHELWSIENFLPLPGSFP